MTEEKFFFIEPRPTSPKKRKTFFSLALEHPQLSLMLAILAILAWRTKELQQVFEGVLLILTVSVILVALWRLK